MHVISEKTLKSFWTRYPGAETPLRAWCSVVRQSRWRTFAELRVTYPAADLVGKFIVFNIGGNKFRLIAVIHFNRAKVYIRRVLTHEEYDKGDWKAD
jgi:mRNA interferase HigB